MTLLDIPRNTDLLTLHFDRDDHICKMENMISSIILSRRLSQYSSNVMQNKKISFSITPKSHKIKLRKQSFFPGSRFY